MNLRDITPDTPGWVYVLCFRGEWKQLRDADEQAPVLHYVGWTQQVPPMKRVQSHGRGMAGYLVLLVRGTMRDEDAMKTNDVCCHCGESLNYYVARR